MDSYSGGQATCDQRDGFQNGWYRFVGASGTQIATSAPPKNRCRTHATGWMQGQHPTVDEGAVTRTVCYHWSSSDCNWSNDIKVRQCPGGFFVYELVKPPACHLRYCTASSSVLPGRELSVFLETGAVLWCTNIYLVTTNTTMCSHETIRHFGLRPHRRHSNLVFITNP